MGGSAARGYLEGPTREMEFYAMGLFGPGYYTLEGGRYGFGRYDPGTRTAFTVAGSARGYLDGPFSRARFGGWDYGFYPHLAMSPDRRYLFATDRLTTSPACTPATASATTPAGFSEAGGPYPGGSPRLPGDGRGLTGSGPCTYPVRPVASGRGRQTHQDSPR